MEKAMQILGYQFQDPELLEEALTHASSAGHRLESNERMEFLGDAVLGFVVSEYLYRNYPQYLEGDLTKIKSAVVSRKVCARISRDLDLCDQLNMGKGMNFPEGVPRSIAAAVLESVIAAIYLDGGMQPATDFILEHVQPYIDEAADSSHQHNFKSALQQYAQKYFSSTPTYMLMDEKGPDHAKCFEVCVELAGRRYEAAWAGSKKEAEQKAALLALLDLGVAEQLPDKSILVHDRSPDEPVVPEGV